MMTIPELDIGSDGSLDYWRTLGVMLLLAAGDSRQRACPIGELVMLSEDRLRHTAVTIYCNDRQQPLRDYPTGFLPMLMTDR